jgi:prophage regulatory protein
MPQTTVLNQQTINERLLRLPEVLQRIPVSKSSWWAWIKDGKTPAGVKLGLRVTAWRESDINDFVSKLGA